MGNGNESESGGTEEKGIRLQVYLARAGLASRRKAEDLIRAGRVRVNGVVAAQLGMRVRPGRDRVELDGAEAGAEPKRYILLNKPAGYICSLSDGYGRKLVTELLEGVPERLVPVGRLDLDTEGLLLLSNDGDFCNLLTHPRHRVPKLYRARLLSPVTPLQLARLGEGVDIGDERPTSPARVKPVKPRELEITIREGRKRQVRRMLKAVGNRVERLERIGIGPLRECSLARGEWRDLTPEEVRSLRDAARDGGTEAEG